MLKVTPSFSLISASDIQVTIEAQNLIPNADNLRCRVGQYVATVKTYSYDSATGKSTVVCVVPSYLSTVASWDYTSDVVVAVDVSNNARDFSVSTATFKFVNQLTLVTGISPPRGPITAGSKVLISLRTPIAVADYNPICKFGNVNVAASLASELVLSCSTTGVFAQLTSGYVKCFKDYFCVVNSSFEIQGSSYGFSYVFYPDPHVTSILPQASGGVSTASILIRGTGMFSYFQPPTANFTTALDGTTVATKCEATDYNTSIYCVPPYGSLFPTSPTLPQKATVEVSVNSAQDWSSDAKKYTFSNEDVPSSLNTLSGPGAGNTKLTIKYSNLFKYTDPADYDGYRCTFTSALNSVGFVVPATLDSTVEELYCLTPPKSKIDGTEEGAAYISVSSNGINYSTTKLTFKYYKEASLASIDGPYLMVDLASTRTLKGTFPAADATITPKIRLAAVGTSKVQVLSTAGYSTSEVTFQTVAGTFAIGDTVQVFISFNAGTNFQTTPFVLKCISSAVLSTVTPTIIHLGTSTSVVNLAGKTFYNIPLYCVFGSTAPVLATRITSGLIACTIPASSTESSATISVNLPPLNLRSTSNRTRILQMWSP